MAKKGMKRPQRTHTKERNDAPPVPEIKNLVSSSNEKPISNAYPTIDTDLGRDNVETDLTAADLQDT